MQKLKRHQHNDRALRGPRKGQFVASPKCDGCGKPVGTAYFSDSDVCGNSDGPGFYLCERERCTAKIETLTIEQKRALYEQQRKINDGK